MKLFKSRCYNGGQKHKYQVVFEEVQAPWLNQDGHSKNISRDMMFEKRYVKYICLWCGQACIDEFGIEEKLELYYIQNGGPVGNCLQWLSTHSGYNADISEAQVFSGIAARHKTKRSIDVLWPKDYIDGKTTQHVDHRNLDHTKSIRADENTDE